jgi:hypothetical protein
MGFYIPDDVILHKTYALDERTVYRTPSPKIAPFEIGIEQESHLGMMSGKR